jgi:hypothetical protein
VGTTGPIMYMGSYIWIWQYALERKLTNAPTSTISKISSVPNPANGLYCPLFGVLLPSTRDNFRIPIDRCIWINVPWKHNADSASTIVLITGLER